VGDLGQKKRVQAKKPPPDIRTGQKSQLAISDLAGVIDAVGSRGKTGVENYLIPT